MNKLTQSHEDLTIDTTNIFNLTVKIPVDEVRWKERAALRYFNLALLYLEFSFFVEFKSCHLFGFFLTFSLVLIIFRIFFFTEIAKFKLI